MFDGYNNPNTEVWVMPPWQQTLLIQQYATNPEGIAHGHYTNPRFTDRSAHWKTAPLFCGTTYGKGDDNPSDPTTLSFFERSRAIMVEVYNTSSFAVRHTILSCCTTGRNFVIGGCESAGRDPPTSAPCCHCPARLSPAC